MSYKSVRFFIGELWIQESFLIFQAINLVGRSYMLSYMYKLQTTDILLAFQSILLSCASCIINKILAMMNITLHVKICYLFVLFYTILNSSAFYSKPHNLQHAYSLVRIPMLLLLNSLFVTTPNYNFLVSSLKVVQSFILHMIQSSVPRHMIMIMYRCPFYEYAFTLHKMKTKHACFCPTYSNHLLASLFYTSTI